VSVSPGFVAQLEELLEAAGPYQVRRMFGGAGLFHDGLMFALLADDVLYLKADAQSQGAFEAEGLAPFTYETSGGKRSVMSYWRAPERLLDDPEEMVSWARDAQAAARREAASKPAYRKARGAGPAPLRKTSPARKRNG